MFLISRNAVGGVVDRVGEEDFFSTEGTDPEQAPELDIAWAPRTGSVDAYTLEGQNLDAKTTAAINVANGNLLVTTNDINSPGTGLDLRFDHYYNSLLDGDDPAALGIRTTASLGRDLRLRLYYGDIVSSSAATASGCRSSTPSPTARPRPGRRPMSWTTPRWHATTPPTSTPCTCPPGCRRSRART